MRGPDPIKGRVTRGIAVKSPVMKSYVPNNFALNAASAVVGGLGGLGRSIGNYQTYAQDPTAWKPSMIR